jgi:predicted GIY-YIG superfamily endonuclease
MGGDRAKRWTAVGTVYLLHFGEPYFHARHYVGFARDVSRRLRQHRAGRGARLMAAIAEAEIGFELARTWENVTRVFERRLHRNRNNPKCCPICAGKCVRPMRPRVEAKTGIAC